MDALLNIALAPAFQSFLVMVIVILIERTWPISTRYHPLTLFRLLAQRMAAKVNPDQTRSRQQQMISGSLAMIVLLVPLLLPVALFIQLADIPQFFDGLLLLFALQYQSVVNQSKKIMMALNREKKNLSRHLLSEICLRQTEALSPVGLVKATIESQLLRFTYQYIAVLFWFLFFGGIAALTYRLLFELNQAWNTKLARNKHFGQPVSSLNKLLNWLPSQLVMLLFMFAENIGNALHAKRQLPKTASTRSKLLSVFAGALNCQLGGPVMYNDYKYRTFKSGPPHFPQTQHIAYSMTAANKTLVIWLILSLLLSACFYALNLKGL